ncbi:hypothetical protein jhhlp_005397 [Lomentospora prolificans]|uniref:Uncharacterized protein n=1 Tax=Lomentospora prolificans TaxID=41688 RepID=A0A2N3N6W7_9PEZI|nr:hypothetical protein jhhlp_005397 [Lomentospora prolificans]
MAVLSVLFESKWPAVLSAALACFSVYIWPRVVTSVSLWNLPTVGNEWGSQEKRRLAYISGAKKMYIEGYRKFKDELFRITTSRDTTVVVVPGKYLPELKLPDSVISMNAAIDESMQVKYTKVETYVPIIPHTVRANLTPALSRLNPSIFQEVQESFALEMPPCNDWTPVNIHNKLLRIVAMVSGRVFIGPELCRSEQYLDAAINYTVELMEARRAVDRMRPWFRPFLASRLPEVRSLDRRIEEAFRFMSPVVEARKEIALDPTAEKPDDMLQWLVDAQEKFPDKNSQNLAKVQLGLSFAAIHTTCLTATNAFYSLAAIPEFVEELREEIHSVLADNDGIPTAVSLQHMKKLDSFLKEVLRVYPATMASFQRKVLKPLKLSNGQVIPAGVTIEVPAVAINSDDEVFPDAENFDPLRFYRLREIAKEQSVAESALNQFVSVSQNSLGFGYGRHACPGRFFAANEIKLILIHAMLTYDIGLVGDSKERYPNIEFAHMCIPDSKRELLFKARNINR